MIIDTFKTENDLKIKYSKTKHFKLKDFFITYWDKFVKFAKDKNLYIRNVVFRDGERMVICNSPKLGTSVFNCPNCGNYKFAYHTCKSRFCNYLIFHIHYHFLSFNNLFFIFHNNTSAIITIYLKD